MARKKKYTLTLDQEFDFDMIGLCSHHSDYRLVWGINQELGLQLARSEEEYLIEGKKNEVYPHVMYEYHSEDDRIDYYLIKNKQNGSTLIPEKPSIDYFLFLVNNGVYSQDELIGKLRKVESVLGVYPFEPEMIDSAEKLVFS